MAMTILNRNKLYVPSESGLERTEYIRLTKIDKESGRFHVSVPEHLHDVAIIVATNHFYKNSDYKSENISYSDGYVTSDRRHEAQEKWSSLMSRCREFLTEREKEKVILLKTEMNVRIFRDDIFIFGRDDISFAKVSTLVGVDYDICYRVDDKLLDEDNRWQADTGGNIVIPYTEEREKFLQHIVERLEEAAIQLNKFSETLKEDPLAIESIMKQGFLLTE